MREKIKDKIINKSFVNEFNHGHLVFDKSRITRLANSVNDRVIIDAITKGIRYADSIKISVNSKCIARQILDELSWLRNSSNDADYVNIKISVSSDMLMNEYSKYVGNISVDKSINYSSINFAIDKKIYTYFIGDNYSLINSLITKDELIKTLSKSIEIIIIRDDNIVSDEVASLIDFCDKKSIAVSLIINPENYDENIYNKAMNCKVNLSIYDKEILNSVYAVIDMNLMQLVTIDDKYTLIEVDGIEFSEIYTLSRLQKNISIEKIQSKYLLTNNTIEKLEIKPAKIVKNVVVSKDYNSFENENFDKSFYNQHNEFCDYKTVDYSTCFTPPILPGKALIFTGYKVLENIASDCIENINMLDEKSKNNVAKITALDEKKILNKYIDIIRKILCLINECKGRNFNFYVLENIEILNNNIAIAKEQIISCLANVFMTQAAGVYDGKLNKIDLEISDKTKLINEHLLSLENPEENQSRLNNKIKRLSEDIDILNKLRLKQSGNVEDLTSTNRKTFIDKIAKYIDGDISKKLNNINSDTIGKVLSSNEGSHISIEDEIFSVLGYFIQSFDALNKLREQVVKLDLPRVGVLFTMDKSIMLAIQYYDQVDSAKDIVKDKNYTLCVER